jgi:hypothetical protein
VSSDKERIRSLPQTANAMSLVGDQVMRRAKAGGAVETLARAGLKSDRDVADRRRARPHRRGQGAAPIDGRGVSGRPWDRRRPQVMRIDRTSR